MKSCVICQLFEREIAHKINVPVYFVSIGELVEIPRVFDFQVTFYPAIIAVKRDEFSQFYDPHLKLKSSAPERHIQYTGINCIVEEEDNPKTNVKRLIHTGFPIDAELINGAVQSL